MTPLKPPPASADEAEIAQRARRLSLGRNAPKAGRALGELGAAAVPALLAALGHANPFVRSGALHGLEAAAATGADVVDPVAGALTQDADPRVRETACNVLHHLGPAAKRRALDALERARDDADERVRTAARRALTPQ